MPQMTDSEGAPRGFRWAGGVISALSILATASAPLTLAQTAPTGESSSTNLPAQTNLTAAQDHKLMMEALHITSLRRGADGNNPQAPNYQNTDESKANPYPSLPDPLVLKNGKKATTAEMWWKERRPEIVEDFDREIYGRVPTNVPKVNWEVTKTTRETNGTFPVVTKQLVGHVD